jgi:4,5-DOPA dioxygenase extradiol
MPVIFIGHGSPMNAIADNAFTKSLNKLGKDLPRPKAIVIISAHWLTHGRYIA